MPQLSTSATVVNCATGAGVVFELAYFAVSMATDHGNAVAADTSQQHMGDCSIASTFHTLRPDSIGVRETFFREERPFAV